MHFFELQIYDMNLFGYSERIHLDNGQQSRQTHARDFTDDVKELALHALSGTRIAIKAVTRIIRG